MTRSQLINTQLCSCLAKTFQSKTTVDSGLNSSLASFLPPNLLTASCCWHCCPQAWIPWPAVTCCPWWLGVTDQPVSVTYCPRWPSVTYCPRWSGVTDLNPSSSTQTASPWLSGWSWNRGSIVISDDKQWCGTMCLPDYNNGWHLSWRLTSQRKIVPKSI